MAKKTIQKTKLNKKVVAGHRKKMRSPEEGGVKKYIVRLSRDEREHLCELLKKGKSSAKLQLKARILLKADVGGGRKGCPGFISLAGLTSRMSCLDCSSRQTRGRFGSWGR